MDSLKRIPLRQLRLSPLNVRQTNPAEDIDGLAEDIRAKGLIENLVGHVGAERNTTEIAAGGRRLQALQLLAKQKAIPRDFAVPVLVVDAGYAREISLSENVQRIALNPADEFEGYARILDQHRDDADPIGLVARRQGVTRHRVEQAMRLANLAPPILEALRAGAISIDAGKAYAGFHDHALQLGVFEAEERRQYGGKHNPREIRDQLKSRTYPAGIAQAAYVGLDAYHAAGGRSERELFMGAEDGDRLIDPSLLDQLARDKAMAELPALAARDGFGEAVLTPGFSAIPPMPRVPASHMQVPGRSIEDVEPAVLARAIGVYTLAPKGEGLELAGWFRAIAEPAPVPTSPPAPVSERAQRFDESFAQATREVQARRQQVWAGDRRENALRTAAGRIAVEHAIGADLASRAIWPEVKGFVPALTTAIGDDDTYLVAVQVRVSREELEALLPEAEHQLDGDNDANDRVVEAEDVVA